MMAYGTSARKYVIFIERVFRDCCQFILFYFQLNSEVFLHLIIKKNKITVVVVIGGWKSGKHGVCFYS